MCTFFLVVAFHDARFLSGLYHRFSYIVMKQVKIMKRISSACYLSIAIWNLKFARLNRSPLALVGVAMPCLSVSERLTSPQPARSTSQGIPRTRVEARRFLAAFGVSQTTDANATCGCNTAKAEVALRCF